MTTAPQTQPQPPAPIPEGILCPDCGYDLRGSTSDRCPECGFVLEPLRSTESQIPWSHRRQLGRFRAYWKTVWLVARNPKRFCHEIARPVSYRDSQRFRWATMLHAYPGLLGASLPAAGHAALEAGTLRAGLWVLAGLQVWCVLLLAALPGLASYFFQSRGLTREQENRVIALSYYAWAPLALLLPVVLFFVGVATLSWALAVSKIQAVELLTIQELLTLVSFAIIIAATDASIAAFAKHTLHRNTASRYLRMMLLRALGAGLVLLTAAFVLSLFYVVLIFYSLA